jgi:hypothetical protein
MKRIICKTSLVTKVGLFSQVLRPGRRRENQADHVYQRMRRRHRDGALPVRQDVGLRFM